MHDQVAAMTAKNIGEENFQNQRLSTVLVIILSLIKCIKISTYAVFQLSTRLTSSIKRYDNIYAKDFAEFA